MRNRKFPFRVNERLCGIDIRDHRLQLDDKIGVLFFRSEKQLHETLLRQDVPAAVTAAERTQCLRYDALHRDPEVCDLAKEVLRQILTVEQQRAIGNDGEIEAHSVGIVNNFCKIPMQYRIVQFSLRLFEYASSLNKEWIAERNGIQ